MWTSSSPPTCCTTVPRPVGTPAMGIGRSPHWKNVLVRILVNTGNKGHWSACSWPRAASALSLKHPALFCPSTNREFPTADAVHPVGPEQCRPEHRQNTDASARSEEHTSELQSRGHLVCRLLL